MKQKNFKVSDRLARELDVFCANRGLTLARVASASILQFITQSSDERDRAIDKLIEFEAELGDEGEAEKHSIAANPLKDETHAYPMDDKKKPKK